MYRKKDLKEKKNCCNRIASNNPKTGGKTQTINNIIISENDLSKHKYWQKVKSLSIKHNRWEELASNNCEYSEKE